MADIETGQQRVYTGEIDEDGGAVSHECVAIDGNRIALVGSLQSIRHWCVLNAEGCSVHHVKPGQSVVPGLHDAHGHVLDLGWASSAVNLVGASSSDEVIRRIEQYLLNNPDVADDKQRWIQGIGWDQTKWTPATFPTAKDLERSSILAGRKIMLRRIDVHALWLSQAALDAIEMAGVMPAVGDEMEGGLVLRGDESGKASGCLIDKAMNLAYKVIPAWTDEDRTAYLDAAAKELLSVGITSVGDAAVDLDSIAFYKKRRHSLPFRIYAFLACPPEQVHCADVASGKYALPIIAKPFTSDRLTVRTVKLFADGALGSWGSAMMEPYDDRPDWRGLMLIAEEQVYPLIRYWTQHGWNVATHCIGDRAQAVTLSAYEKILHDDRLTTADQARFRIEHAQLIRAQDIARFGRSSVIASVQPTHCTSDMAYVERRIGAERARQGAYPWASLLKANATLALGSDFPVEQPNPIEGFYSAITRLDAHQRSPDGNPQGWYPEQRLSRAQALHGFTAAPAFAQFEEQVGGTMNRGKRADFVVLDDDLITQTDLATLRRTAVLATFIDGKVAWHR
jgi:hypothetical protein